jgi:hypothetical protein
MGMDLYAYAERRVNGIWVSTGTRVFIWDRNVAIFKLLGGHAAGGYPNEGIQPIVASRGLPDEMSAGVQHELSSWDVGLDRGTAKPVYAVFGESWLTVEELLSFDYKSAPPTSWNATLVDALGEEFFADLNRLKAEGAERIVFWFDN